MFDRILQVAIDGNLKEDQMIKRIFVFSGMEFNEQCSGYYNNGLSPWDTISEEDNAKACESMYEEIQKKFLDKGFNIPEIVFWKLNHSSVILVPSNRGGVALVSGFSKNLVELFLDNGGVIDPVTVMEQAISGEMYNKLCVYD